MIEPHQRNSRQALEELRCSRFEAAEEFFKAAVKDLNEMQQVMVMRQAEEIASQFDPAYWGEILREDLYVRRGLMDLYCRWGKDVQAELTCFEVLAWVDAFYGTGGTDWTDPQQPLPRHAEAEDLVLVAAAKLALLYDRAGKTAEAAAWRQVGEGSKPRPQPRKFKLLTGNWSSPNGHKIPERVLKIRYDVEYSLSSYKSFTHAVTVKAPYWSAGERLSRKELWALRKIEQELYTAVEAEGVGMYLACIPEHAHRLFLFYSSDWAATEKTIERTAAGLTSHQLIVESVQDRHWNTYRRWAGMPLVDQHQASPATATPPPALSTALPEPSAKEFITDRESALFADLWRIGRTIPGDWSQFYNLACLTKRVPTHHQQLLCALEYFLSYVDLVSGDHRTDVLSFLAKTVPALDHAIGEQLVEKYEALPIDSITDLSSFSVGSVATAIAPISPQRALALCVRAEVTPFVEIAGILAQKDPKSARMFLDKAIEAAFATDAHSALEIVAIAEAMPDFDPDEKLVSVVRQAISELPRSTDHAVWKWHACYAFLQWFQAHTKQHAKTADAFADCFEYTKLLLNDLKVSKESIEFQQGAELACRASILTAEAVKEIVPAEAMRLLEDAVELAAQMNRREDPVLSLCRIVTNMKILNPQRSKEIFRIALQTAREIPITYLTPEAPKVGADFKALSLTKVLAICPEDEPDTFAEVYQECLDVIEKVKVDRERFSAKLRFAASLVNMNSVRGRALFEIVLADSATRSGREQIELMCRIASECRVSCLDFRQQLWLQAVASARTMGDTKERYCSLSAVLISAAPDGPDITDDIADELVNLALALNLKESDFTLLVHYLSQAKTEKCTRAVIRIIENGAAESRAWWMQKLVEGIGKKPEIHHGIYNQLSNW